VAEGGGDGLVAAAACGRSSHGYARAAPALSVKSTGVTAVDELGGLWAPSGRGVSTLLHSPFDTAAAAVVVAVHALAAAEPPASALVVSGGWFWLRYGGLLRWLVVVGLYGGEAAARRFFIVSPPPPPALPLCARIPLPPAPPALPLCALMPLPLAPPACRTYTRARCRMSGWGPSSALVHGDSGDSGELAGGGRQTVAPMNRRHVPCDGRPVLVP